MGRIRRAGNSAVQKPGFAPSAACAQTHATFGKTEWRYAPIAGRLQRLLLAACPTTFTPSMTHTPQGIQARHQQALDQGRFLIQQCSSCRKHVYFPREVCPHCGALAPALVAPSGGGTVQAVTTVHRKADQGGNYGVCLIDLDEGVRLMSRVEGLAPEAVTVGLRVRARVLVNAGRGLVVFDPEVAA
jgi:hypothetical protein